MSSRSSTSSYPAKPKNDLDFLVNIFPDLDAETLQVVYESKNKDVAQTLEFLLSQITEDDLLLAVEAEERDVGCDIDGDDESGAPAPATATATTAEDEQLAMLDPETRTIIESLSPEERQQVIAEQLFYEYYRYQYEYELSDAQLAAELAAYLEAEGLDDNRLETIAAAKAVHPELSNQYIEVWLDMASMFPKSDPEYVLAQLIAFGFDPEYTFAYLSVTFKRYLDPQNQKGKKTWYKRDDLLGAKYGLIRSAWHVPSTTAALTKQMKIDRIKSLVAPFASDRTVYTIFEYCGEDIDSTIEQLKLIYPEFTGAYRVMVEKAIGKSSSDLYQQYGYTVISGNNGTVSSPSLAPATSVGQALSEAKSERKRRRKLTPNQIRRALTKQYKHDQSFKNYRAEAHRLANERNKYFRAALRAFYAGDGRAARALSDAGRKADELLKEANRMAAHYIFIEKNAAFNVTRIIDLHGLLVDEALAVLEEHIDLLEQLGQTQCLKVIVGKGIHSREGGPRIKNAVTNWLRNNDYIFESKESEGHVVVYLKRDD